MAVRQGATPPAWRGRSRVRLLADVIGGARQNWDKLRQLASLVAAYFRPRLVRRRLERLRALNVRPILGLVHHGSGPRYTNLLDDGFATGLAAHAGAVAERIGG